MNHRLFPVRLGFTLFTLCFVKLADAQLLSNLKIFGNSVSLIDENWNDPENLETDGPKELVTADFDGDNHADLAASKVFGKIAVVFGKGGKDFTEVQFLIPPDETGELRGITAADFNGDSFPDIAVAAPFSGRVIIFHSKGDQTFDAPITIEAWRGVRNLLSLDLDGDGDQDLIAAGPMNQGNTSTTSTAGARPLINNENEFTTGEELLLNGGNWTDSFPRPVFSMSALPSPANGQGEQALVTHANSGEIWILKLDETGNLIIRQTLPAFLSTRALAAGPVSSPDGSFDLIQAARDENQILIRKGDGEGGFEQVVSQQLYIPGAPRAVQLADVDGDGWNDLLVVLRNYDRVVTFHNDGGTLSLVAEAPVGSSPRDLAAADFNQDGRLDLAVSNRRSDNISVLLTQADSSGFERFDSVYDVDGGVSDLRLVDMNNDGRDDVVQSHILTSEISVRLSGTDGTLSAPIYSRLNAEPVSFSAEDFNNDGSKDLIIVHNSSALPGITLLFGDGTGNFGPPSFLPSLSGGLFSVIVSDFDGDGIQDAAVGNYDCRLSMYKGNSDGGFEVIRTGRFAYEARAMIAGDFDQDGDLDLAGASANGNMTVVTNDGNLLKPIEPGEKIYQLQTYISPAGKGRIKSMVTVNWNGDQDPDLAINSEDGVTIFVGGEGLSFEALPDVLSGTRGASDLVLGDFDGDGTKDMASACRLLSCVVILKGQEGGGSYEIAAINPVPAADHIATGDIDGDGLADLAGSGEVLWVALSSRAPYPADGSIESSRPPIDSVVINEVLASNKNLYLLGDDNTPDALELFNGQSTPIPLAGWQLTYQSRTEEGQLLPPRSHRFLGNASMEPQSHLLLYCDNEFGANHTPFKLSRFGGTITLWNQEGDIVDSLTYDLQEKDTSYGRYSDGALLIDFKEEPDLGFPNYSNFNSIKPSFEEVLIVPNSLISSSPKVQPIIQVKATDRVGIFTLNAVWRTMDGAHSGRIGLFDDGMHNDGGMLDGWFGTTFPHLPSGSKVEFFLQATNLIDEEETSPGDPVFSLPGSEVINYAFTIPDPGEPLPTIEISEVQPHRAGLDANAVASDYIEIRNTGASVISLNGLAVREAFFEKENSYSLDGELSPGEHLVLFASGNPNLGPNHMPFRLDDDGEPVWLVTLDERGIVNPLDQVNPASLSNSHSWARLGIGGDFFPLPPSQGRSNLENDFIFSEYLPNTEEARFRMGFSSPLNTTSTLEYLDTSGSPSWKPLQDFQGNGFEQIMEYPLTDPTRLFRIRRR